MSRTPTWDPEAEDAAQILQEKSKEKEIDEVFASVDEMISEIIADRHVDAGTCINFARRTAAHLWQIQPSLEHQARLEDILFDLKPDRQTDKKDSEELKLGRKVVSLMLSVLTQLENQTPPAKTGLETQMSKLGDDAAGGSGGQGE